MSPGKKDKGRDLLLFIGFMVVSSCLWLLKVAGENLEAEISIGITVENLPQELQLEDEAELRATVMADGADLIAYMLGKELRMVVDYNDMQYIDGRLTIPTSQLVNSAASSLPGSFTFRYFKDNVLVMRTNQLTVALPVMMGSSLVAADGLELGDVELRPKTVKVTAPSTMFRNLSFIEFATDSLTLIERDTVLYCYLQQSKFVKYEPAMLEARVKTEPFVSVSLTRTVDISQVCGGLEDSLCLLPVPVTVTCKVPKSMVEELGDEYLKVGAVAQGGSAGVPDTVRFGVSALPFFVKEGAVSIEPEYVVIE